MRNYQRKKNNPYLLPDTLYRHIFWLVRDYDRKLCEWKHLIDESYTPDGQPRGADLSDPTANKAIRREHLRVQLEAVRQALLCIPEEYREGILGHVKYGVRFPDYANINTWKRWQARFLYYIAKRLHEI